MVAHNCHGKTKNLTAKTKTSRQNQKPHSKNKIPHGKTKNLTAKTKYLTAKPNTSQQKQNSFGFAVRFLFLPWGILVLPWGFWFCRDSCGPPYVGLEPASLDVKSIWVSTTPSRANCRYRLILTYSTWRWSLHWKLTVFITVLNPNHCTSVLNLLLKPFPCTTVSYSDFPTFLKVLVPSRFA